MRKFTFLVCLLFLLASIAFAQTVHYVYPYPLPGPDNYAKIQDAVNAASSGDTVYVSSGTHGSFSTTLDTLTVIGSGWAKQGLGTNTNVSLVSTKIGVVGCYSGSFVSLGFLEATSVILRDSANVVIDKCLISSGLDLTSSGNVSIGRSIIKNRTTGSWPSTSYDYLIGDGVDTFIVSNTIFCSTTSNTPKFDLGDTKLTIINQSVVEGSVLKSSTSLLHTVNTHFDRYTSVFVNTQALTHGTNCSFTSTTTPINSAIANPVFTPDPMFTAHPQGWPNWFDTSSPLSGAGFGGVDIGVYAGFTLFIHGVVPQLPEIYEMGTNAINQQGTSSILNVKVRAQ